MQLLHSKIIGEGKPLLILHGFLGMSDNWKTLGTRYAKIGFQVHLIDQRNHGKSFHTDAFNYDLLALDIKNYISHHQLENVLLLGHSMGGKTAMQFACSYPTLLEKLLVADIAPKYYPPHHQELLNALSGLSAEDLSSRKSADTALAVSIDNIGIRQFLLKNLYWVTKEQLGFRCNLPILRNRMEEVGEDLSATATFNGPVLFLGGDRSEYIIPSDMSKIRTHFPNATMDTITDAGHWLHAEQPKQFFERSSTFMTAN